MKTRYIIPLMLLLIVFISGCTSLPPTPPPDKPYIKSFQVQNGFIHYNSNERATLGFVVYNPLQVTFSGKIELQNDNTGCLIQPSIKEFTVESKQSLPLSIDVTADTYSYNENKCIGTHTVTVILKDIKGTILDAKSGEINIVQR